MLIGLNFYFLYNAISVLNNDLVDFFFLTWNCRPNEIEKLGMHSSGKT